ncbi:hypothetical protein QYM36_015587 [Artemia franciscana]|uniref:HAT C-terminal dimerisation domain-containing protein n=1 Tax=Artemia franciscana TaxID=6661 RepID=A0AA88KUW8_ARTSF|nr:hypothetical protein QYM36_015587 [Artemia franciscana]
MLVLSGRILNERGAELIAKRLHAKLLDDLSNVKSLVDIVLSYDYLKYAEKRQKKSLLMRVREHFRASASYLLKYISSNSNSARLLKSLRCFRPTERKTARSSKDIGFIATKLQVGVSRLDVLDDELKLMQLEKDPDLAATTSVIKAALCLSHGSASVERGFSLSGKIMSEQRAAMGERMLNAKLTS